MKTYKDYWNVYKNKHGSLTNQGFSKIYFSLIKIFPTLNKKLYYIMKLPKNAKVLDIGCGCGAFLRVVNNIRPDLNLYGVDIEDSGFKEINFEANIRVCSGDKLPFDDNFFDYVGCQHVLEHVLNPEDFVREFKRVTKKYILLVAPNYKNIFLFGSQNFYRDFTHIRPFSKMGFDRLVKMQKLKVLYLNNERFINLPLPILLLLFPIFLFRKNISGWFGDIIFKRAVVVIAKKNEKNNY